MDLGGQTLIGSKSHDSFKIFTNGNGVNANGIEIVNLDRTINANGAVTLSGAQNNIWQLMDMKGELKDSRDNGFIFIGVNAANLQGETLNASAAQNKFDITGAQKLTAADIDFTEVASVTGNSNQGHVITNADANLAADKHVLTTQNITFTGINKADLQNNTLTASTAQNSFNVTGSKALTAADIEFTGVISVVGDDNQGQVITGADANLAAGKHALTTQNITFTGINKADLQNNTLTASTAQNSFNVNGSKALTAADIDFTEVASVTGNSNQGHVITNADANLEADKHALTTQGIGFTGIGSMDLNGQSLIGSEHNDSFQILVDGIKTNGIKTTNLNRTINANGAVILSGAQNNIWQLMDMKGELKDSRDNGFIFIGVNAANLQGETLNASAAQNKFDITGAQKLTAADINFTGVTSVVGDNNQGQVTTNADANLAADKHALTTQGIVFTGINKADLQNNALTASTEQNGFNVTGSKALTVADIDFTGVTSVAGDDNQGQVITGADANLEADKHALTTQGIGFTGIGSMDLNGQSLIGSEHDDSFQILVDGVKANGIKTTNLNRTINANGAVILSGAQKNIWQLMDMKGELKDSRDNGFIFIGVNAANLQGETLNASAAQNKFDITGAQKLTAADIDFTEVASVTGNSNQGHVITNADANLAAGKHALTTQNITFTGINKADLQNKALTASTEQNSFNVTGSKALTAADIDFTGVTSVIGSSNQGQVITGADANLEADKHALTTQGIGFTGIGSMDLNGQSLIGSEHNDSFQILVDGVKANGIKTTNLNRTINANGAVILSGAQNNIWQLMDMKGELKDSRDNGFIFIGVNAANLQGETLNASAAQNKFDITGAQKLTAADINFTGVTSVVGDNNQGQVTTNADANLAADKHALTSQNIIFTGIGSAALGGNKLTASTEQNSFSVTGSKALTAADIEFTGVASVTDNSNQGHVITNADANLEADKHALTTQGIGFTGIGSMDLNGQSLIGSEHDDSFQILVDGVKANGIKTTNLNRTINANGAVTLSGAQNNIWQLMDMKGELKDSRDNGFIFIGVNAANLQGETLNASAAQNKFDITGAQKLTAADIDFSNVAEVNAYDNKGYVITNNVAELTDGKNQLKTQGVIINGVDQAYLSNNALKGSATGSTLELISESRVDASGIKFFDFGELDGNENTGALVSKLDAPQWTMTTANSGTVNNIKFKAFKTLENSVGDLKLNVGEKVGGVEFKGDNLNFGGNSSLVFNSQNNVTVNSTNNINGSLVAKDLNINTTGDVDLKTQIDSITLNANNANLVQEGDLEIHSIDVGRTLNLNSADAGKNNLIAGNSGRT